MKFSVGVATFAAAVSRASLAINRKTSIPVLINLLVSVDEKGVRVFGTDTMLGAVSKCDAVDVKTAGRVAVDEERLTAIMAALPSGKKVTFTLTEEKLRVQCGKAIYHLLIMPPEGYPEPMRPVGKGEPIKREDLLDLIKWTEHAICDDGSRAHLHGSRFTGTSEALSMMATDSRRLAVGKKKWKGKGFSLFLPLPSITGLKKFCESVADEEVSFVSTATHFFCWTETAGFSTKTVDAPVLTVDKLQVKPTTRVTIAREGLVEALTRMRVISEDPVRLYFDKDAKTVEITSSNPQAGDGKEVLSVGVKGKDVEVCLSVGKVLDACNAASSKHLNVGIRGSLDPVTLEPQDETDLIMILMPLSDAS